MGKSTLLQHRPLERDFPFGGGIIEELQAWASERAAGSLLVRNVLERSCKACRVCVARPSHEVLLLGQPLIVAMVTVS
jgi:hypothetical protein